jgi:hypothetical protein
MRGSAVGVTSDRRARVTLTGMSFRSEWGPINTRGANGDERPVHGEIRRATRSSQFAVGSLACSRCDAPVSPGDGSHRLTDLLACPFCAHRAPVRQFLTLGAPTRPARVVLRVVHPIVQLAS